jgi:hypothetical protein
MKLTLCALAYSRVFPAGEQGIFYEDLYHLVKPLHEVSHLHHFVLLLTADQHHAHHIVSESPTAVDRPWRRRGKSEQDPLIPPITAYGSVSIARTASGSSGPVPPTLLPASNHRSLSVLDRVSGDLIPFAEYLRGVFSFYRFSDISDTQPVRTVLATDREAPALIRIDGRGRV